LAVLGAAAVGALGTGGLLRVLGRLTFTRGKLPNWLRNTLRLLGAVALGSLAALMFFGNGHWGFGGPGGFGLGAGAGLGEGTPTLASKEREAEKEKPAEPGPEPVDESESVQIEVLGADAVRRLAGEKAADEGRRYRLDTGPSSPPVSLADLKTLLRMRQQAGRPVRQVTLVLYRDSPDRRTAAVADLKSWVEESLPPPAKGERILLNIDLRSQNAPAK
jgi:hypothetical protein